MTWRDRLTAMLSAGDGEPQTRDAPDTGAPMSGAHEVSRDQPPKDDYHRYRKQYRTSPLAAAALDLRASEIVRPGYRVEVDDEDETEGESLEEQLKDWASSAAYYSGEAGEDLMPLLWNIARDRDLDGTVLVENVWDNPAERASLEGVKQFDPGQTDFLTPENSALLFPADEAQLPTDQNGTRIDPGKRTAAGDVASFVQYPEGWGFGNDEVYLSQNDVFKLTRSPGFSDQRAHGGNAPPTTEFGPNRGVSILESVTQEIERLEARLQDYNAAIASNAYPRLLVEFEDFERGSDLVAWDREKMQEYMGQITRDDVDKRYQLDGSWVDPGGSAGSPPGVSTELVEGSVPDVMDSLQFSVDYILSGLRVPKAMIGFGDNINRDITGDQRGQFEQDIHQARRQIERKFLTPLFRMKAREIRGDGPFDDSVDVSDVCVRLEPEEEENPLKDEDFDAAEFKTMVEGIATLLDSGAEVHIDDLDGLLGDLLNMDLSEYAVDEDDLDRVQDEMGPLADDVGPDGFMGEAGDGGGGEDVDGNDEGEGETDAPPVPDQPAEELEADD